MYMLCRLELYFISDRLCTSVSLLSRYLCAENDKSFEEQQEEEYLIQRKVDIVNQRNYIVESIDEDRLRLETHIILSLKSEGRCPSGMGASLCCSYVHAGKK